MVGVGDVTSALVSMKMKGRRNDWGIQRHIWGEMMGYAFKMIG